MSVILTDLRAAVTSVPKVQTGTVTEVTALSIIVSSPFGRREFRVPSPGLYSIGSTVRFQGEVLIGFSPGREGLISYSV